MAGGGHLSYVYVGKGMNNAAGAAVVVAYEPVSNHGTGSNFLFGDGSARFIRKPHAERMIQQTDRIQNPRLTPAILDVRKIREERVAH